MIQCPLCNGNSRIFMQGIFDCDKTFVMECEKCNLHFLNPKMTIEEESEYYRNYYENQKNTFIVSHFTCANSVLWEI